MATAQTRNLPAVPPLRRPTELEIQQAQEAIRRLDPASSRSINDHPAIVRDADGIEIEIPSLARNLLGQILHELARGNAVALEPVRPLLTVAQAAGILGVPEAFVAKLIEDGELTGQIERNRPWVVFDELMAYKKENDDQTSKALDEMVSIAQELGLGY